MVAAVASLPFTLRYPNTFQVADATSLKRTSAVAIVGVPGEGTFIAVRANGATPLSTKALTLQARRGLGTKGVTIRVERHSGVPMVAATTPVLRRPDLTSGLTRRG